MDDHQRLYRIENGIKFLVRKFGFPYRIAHDGKKWDEIKDQVAEEERIIDEVVEKIMSGEK